MTERQTTPEPDERPRLLRVLIEGPCHICAVAGRPCGGNADTCALIGCSACQGVTWRRDEAESEADPCAFLRVCDEMYATADGHRVLLWAATNDIDEMATLTFPQARLLRDWLDKVTE